MEKRDQLFYSELKKLNEDLIDYLKQTQEKSPYFDFSPTLDDYIKQFKELDKKYPEKLSLFPTTTTSTTNSTPFSFGAPPAVGVNSSISTNSTPFSFGASLGTGGGGVANSGATTNNAPLSFFGAAVSANNSVLSNQGTVTASDSAENDAEGDAANADDDDAQPPEPNVEKYDEPDSRYSVKCKLYERGRTTNNEVSMNLLGIGQLFIKPMEDQNKRQIVFRQDPDLRRVLVNEVLTPNNPVKSLPKAVQMMFPTADGGTKFYIAKVKDEALARTLEEHLKFTS